MWFLVVVALLVSLAALAVALRRPGTTSGGAAEVPADVAGLRAEVAALKRELAGAVRHVAVVRYDAFGDMGGHLSWSLALLDDAGDGVLLTSIHGRQDTRTYAKTVVGFGCEQPLSDEEQQALAHVRG